MSETSQKRESIRERKRRDSHRHLSETGLRLFSEKGFEATTINDITGAAGIARRTFFHYFSSKEEIILAWQNDLPGALYTEIVRRGKTLTPLALVSESLMTMTVNINPDIAMLITKLMQSTEQLRMGNQAKFLRMEEAAYSALRELWPGAERQPLLRIVAMTGVGVMRLAIDTWLSEDCQKPLGKYLEASFSYLRSDLINP